MTDIVSIVILHYNNINMTKECIKSCLKQDFINKRIIIVDNHSTNNSVGVLKDEFKDEVLFVENEENYGFAKGNNIGISASKELGCKYTLLLNNDIILFNPNTVTKLYNIMVEHKECAVVAPLVYNITKFGLELNNNDSKYLKLLRLFRVLPSRRMIDDELEVVNELHGSVLFVDVSKFLEVGGFPEHYFMYGEESTFEKKVLWKNYSLLWYKNGKHFILHNHDKSTSVDRWRRFLMGRNRMLEYLENKDIAPFRWGIAFLVSLFPIFINDKIYVKGIISASKLHGKQVDKRIIFEEAKKAISSIGR